MLLPIAILVLPGETTAQIVSDDTLPNNSSVQTQGDRTLINGGTPRGSNLYHSFEEFSVPTGTAAWFNNDAAVENIITRVTGSNLSNIDGLVGANGSANLFLLNPNGIIFGPNAQLEIGGSFVGSTAESIFFKDKGLFSATAPHTSLLTISTPIGLQIGSRSAPITVQGTGSNLFFTPFFSVDRSLRAAGLQVQPGRTLALVGGEIRLAGGNLTAAEGRIELSSVGAEAQVALMPTVSGWTLSSEALGQDIYLTEAASLDTSGRGGGDLHIHGRRVVLSDGSAILASTFGSASGGTLTVRAAEMVLAGETVDGQFRSGLYADVLPGAAGSGGNIDIKSDRLSLDAGAVIGAATFSSGKAGNLTIEAAEIEIKGITADGRFPSGLFTGVLPGATGDGGAIAIVTERLSMSSGAQIGTSTLGIGDAGDLMVEAAEIELIGSPPNEGFPSGLSTNALPGAVGSGGDLTINTNSLLIADGGAVTASNAGFGSAGDITVTADSIAIIGTAKNAQLLSNLSATSTSDFAAGSVQIETKQLTVQDGAEISVSSLGAGEAGNLTITADAISLNQGSLQAEARAGNQGNIALGAATVLLRRGSRITTNATGTATGGNITINTDALVALENSDITANAETSFGGQVTIAAQGVFGTEFRDQLTPSSDITASSQLGVQFSGQVNIQTPEIQSDYGVVELETVIDPTELIATGCTATDNENTFVMTGRGGLPENPAHPLRSQSVWLDWRTAVTNPPTDRAYLSGDTPGLKVPASIVEARGWMVNAQGNLELAVPMTTRAGLNEHCRI